MKARISIIMGIYNCATTLSEAIDSILNQTYPHWKLIMCDDGSMDDTYEVARVYCERYPGKIMLLKNECNMGLNYTLNHCLKYADTEYIARMDGDDISLPTRLEGEIAFLDNHPEYDIVSCPMIYFDEKGDFMQGVGRGEPSIKDYVKGTPFCHAPCMVRRTAYIDVNGYSVSENRLRVEDWDLWVRMRAAGHKGFNLRDPLYKMRDNRDAIGRRKLKYRFNESSVIVQAIGIFKLSPVNYLRAIRPIAVGLLPPFVYEVLHKIKTR